MTIDSTEHYELQRIFDEIKFLLIIQTADITSRFVNNLKLPRKRKFDRVAEDLTKLSYVKAHFVLLFILIF